MRKILLLEDLSKKYKKDNTLVVKRGYANFLVLQKKAIFLDDKKALKRKIIEEEQHLKQVSRKKEDNKKIKKKIEALLLEFSLRISSFSKKHKKKNFFNKITSRLVCKKIKDACGVQIRRSQLTDFKGIFTVGTFNIKVNLGDGIVANLKVFTREKVI
jgi:large subunit ribosomal protein L9